MKKSLIFLLIALCLVMPTFANGKNESNENSEGSSQQSAVSESSSNEDTITMAMVSTWDSLIPFDTTSSYSGVILDLIYDKLVYLKADGTYEPRLAESVEMNEDSTVMTFNLRKDAYWSDGEPVTAADVVFTAKAYASPSVNALRKNQCNNFVGFGESDDSLAVKALDDYTVEFQLTEPTNKDFLLFTKFRDIYILPEHLLNDVPLKDIRTSSYWDNPVSSGPCVYEKEITGERIEFSANQNYYNTPEWDKFVVRVVPTSNLLAGLMNGEIDCLAGNVASLQLSDWDMAQQQKNLVCNSLPAVNYQYMAINTSKSYMTSEIRRIINMTINRELIVDGLLQGEGVQVFGPIPPNNIYYNDEIEEPYNPEEAKKLLAESGWDYNRTLIMSVPSGNTIREQAAVIIQQNLAEIGMKAKIVTADFATHLNRVRKGDYDFGFIGSSGSPDPSECVINFNPDHINNFSQLSDWTIFETGDKGGHVFGFEDRKICYDEYQKLLRQEVPFAFLYSSNLLEAHNKNITGIENLADSTQLNHDVWNWKIK